MGVHVTYEHCSHYRKTCECWELMSDGISISRTFKKSFEGRTTQEALEKSRDYAELERDKKCAVTSAVRDQPVALK